MRRKGVLGPAEQVKTLRHVLAQHWIKDWSVAIDGGAHSGEWARVMAERFAVVHAFEPAPDTYARLAVPANVVTHNSALLDRECMVQIMQPAKRTSTRARYVVANPSGTTKAETIDGLELESCGLIKLDLEGAEHLAIVGAKKTIKRCRPVVVVEINGRERQAGAERGAARRELVAMGYREVWQSHPDSVFVPC